jgi:hypothetical protein
LSVNNPSAQQQGYSEGRFLFKQNFWYFINTHSKLKSF